MQSTFLKEIEEQPAALLQLVDFYRGKGRFLLDEWRSWAEQAHLIVFSGMGTSEVVAESILPKLASQGLDAIALDAGEMLHYPRYLSGMQVVISQSGESAETKKVAEKLAQTRGFFSVTNNPASSIATWAELDLPMLAGEETAISTKTYINSLGVLFLMAEPYRSLNKALDRLELVAGSMMRAPREAIEKAADLLADAEAIHCVGRGPAMAAVKQAALTFMEGCKVSVTPLTGGALRHGPLELADSKYRCLVFIPQGSPVELLQRVSMEIAEKGGRVVVMTDTDLEMPGDRSCVIRVPNHGEDLFSLSAATAQEWLLEAVARRRGVVPGNFRHGQKVTTFE